ncbi:MAG: hypothetical protein BWY27_01474 [Bacteroidetes bacterium ADurb.Bin234]|jgi:hypothetical protein|nr:MAG: hypothetical protein BWY27_01474 [Bacteroidetes bacterium ADurb.Bin234]
MQIYKNSSLYLQNIDKIQAHKVKSPISYSPQQPVLCNLQFFV